MCSTSSVEQLANSYISSHEEEEAKMRRRRCVYPVYTPRLASKQARRKRARGRESCVVIIDQEDGNSTESLSL